MGYCGGEGECWEEVTASGRLAHSTLLSAYADRRCCIPFITPALRWPLLDGPGGSVDKEGQPPLVCPRSVVGCVGVRAPLPPTVCRLPCSLDAMGVPGARTDGAAAGCCSPPPKAPRGENIGATGGSCGGPGPTDGRRWRPMAGTVAPGLLLLRGGLVESEGRRCWQAAASPMGTPTPTGCVVDETVCRLQIGRAHV